MCGTSRMSFIRNRFKRNRPKRRSLKIEQGTVIEGGAMEDVLVVTGDKGRASANSEQIEMFINLTRSMSRRVSEPIERVQWSTTPESPGSLVSPRFVYEERTYNVTRGWVEEQVGVRKDFEIIHNTPVTRST